MPGHCFPGVHVVITNDVQDELAEGFEPGPLPPMGPEGAMIATAPVHYPEPPPRLCEQGPCVHYHRFELVMDAAKPIGAELDEDGHVIGRAPEVRNHLEIHHYCYPTVGIEMILGSLPVVHCLLWEPKSPERARELERTRQVFLESKEGADYKTALDLWKAKQLSAMAEEQRQIDDAAHVLAAATAIREED